MIKSKERIKQTAEVFTPPALTNEILDHLPVSLWEPDKTFCDPAAGNGNLLLEVLKRKISLGHSPIDALKTIYGVELMLDNVIEMKSRLLDLIPIDDRKEAQNILDKQIINHDSLTWDFINWKSSIKNYRKLF
jgi:hypothetical protein